MTIQLDAPRHAAAPPARRGLGSRSTFALLVSVVVALLASSSAPTPLYAIYEAQWHFGPLTSTVVFGVYALAVLVALLTVGSLSDHLGRRKVLLVAVSLQALTMLVFAAAGGVPELVAARVLQGLWTGAAIGAIGAGLVDLHAARGTLASAVGPMAGTAVGGVVSGLLVLVLPAPTHLIFVGYAVVFALQAVGLALTTETSAPRTSRPPWASVLRPTMAVPGAARGAMAAAVPTLIACWAIPGFFASLGPVLISQVVGTRSAVVGSLGLLVLAGTGAAIVVATRSHDPARLTRLGVGAIAVGIAITLVAAALGSAPALFAGMVVAGAGFGGAYQGTMRSVLPLAAPHERAGLISTLFVVSYLALGLPAIVAGVLLAGQGDIIATAREYGCAIIALCAVAGIAFVLTSRRPARTANVSPCPSTPGAE